VSVLSDSPVFIHAHHGVAVADGSPVTRDVSGHAVEMQRLATSPAPAWFSLLNVAGGAKVSTPPVVTMVPVALLASAETSWTPCPLISLGVVTAYVRSLPVDLWINQVSVPYPAKMVERCSASLGELGKASDPDLSLGELIVQIGDYLSLWYLSSLDGERRTAAKQKGLSALGAGISSSLPFWSELVGKEHAFQAGGRHLISTLARVASVVAAGSGHSPQDVASEIDRALSERLTNRLDELRAAAGGLGRSPSQI